MYGVPHTHFTTPRRTYSRPFPPTARVPLRPDHILRKVPYVGDHKPCEVPHPNRDTGTDSSNESSHSQQTTRDQTGNTALDLATCEHTLRSDLSKDNPSKANQSGHNIRPQQHPIDTTAETPMRTSDPHDDGPSPSVIEPDDYPAEDDKTTQNGQSFLDVSQLHPPKT